MKPTFIDDSFQPVRFRTKHRAGFLDLDIYGHLNSIAYLKLITEHRFSQMFEVIGWSLSRIQNFSSGFYVNRFEIDYLRPISGDDDFIIESWVDEVDESTCIVVIEITKSNSKAAAKAKMHLSNVDRSTGRPVPWTSEILQPFFGPKSI